MADVTISWDDVLEVGAGGPGCGLLYLNGKQPGGGYRYLPPALLHDGKVYASTFVPGGFIICAIDPVTLHRYPITPRLPYARLQSIADGIIDYVDRHDGDSISRVPLAVKTGVFAALRARFRRR